MILWAILAIVLIAIDRITKIIIVQNVEYGEMITVIDNFFFITNHDNYGAAWGILQNARYFFIVITIIVLIFIVYYMTRNRHPLLRTALAVISGGAAGNLIDRIAKGGVTDFLEFQIGSYVFPTFNAADTFVVCGTILLIYYMIFVYKEPSKESLTQKETGIDESDDR